MNRTYRWNFPLPRTHTGMLLGNGTMGAMIWGGGNTLKITLNRADFWDHRGGKVWTQRMNYTGIRALLEAGDEAGLQAIFGKKEAKAGEPFRPTVLPLGRLELVFGEGVVIRSGELDLGTGEIRIELGEGGRAGTVRLNLSMSAPLLHVELPEGLARPTVRRVTAWEHVGATLKSLSLKDPGMFDGEVSGWVQERPADEPLCLGYRTEGRELWAGVVYGKAVADARERCGALLGEHVAAGAEALRAAGRKWWGDYWARVPKVEVPAEAVSFLYYYGMYKFAGLTNPTGVAATLQGPWVEEYQMPPWSSDYHFNINVQMCYWPAYQSGLWEHLGPLWKLIGSWKEKLREHARLFVGIEDGLMLPHAVDDRCAIMGGFWTGTIDHGCTAWVAKMMYDYFLYSGDEAFLRETAYPFMVGAMRVYEEMLEKVGDGYRLPVSVSPEYRGAALNAWGANASFQLACIHWLCESLEEAAGILGVVPRPIWREIREKLPKASVLGEGAKREIALWDGTALEESHRHHSHLAAIAPFDVIDPNEAEWKEVVDQSARTWVAKGMGAWSGWCVPWASMLHARLGNADMAQLLLEIWQKVYTNQGHGTLHDCEFPGFTLIGAGPRSINSKTREIMQMDAGMGVTTAVMDLMIHTRRGVNHLFSGAPARWASASFENLRVAGGFAVSARREGGPVSEVVVRAGRAGTFVLASPWGGGMAKVKRAAKVEEVAGEVLRIALEAGERVTLEAAR